jgi:phosphoenolpyruvate carboxykinase (ATP)
MNTTDDRPARFALEPLGIRLTGDAWWNLPAAVLIEHAVRRGEGRLAASGALVTTTGAHTGRSPNDRYIVREPSCEDTVWWGSVNVPLAPEHWPTLRAKVIAALGHGDVYVRDAWCGAKVEHRIGVRVVTTSAWHSLFARNMFLRPEAEELARFAPDWTVLHAPAALADPEHDGTRSGTFVVLNFAEREVIIGGTQYAGEIKKSIFSVMNHRLPDADVLPMHCSANVGADGDSALFFGLSGTGKTTISADPERPLVGDDEHGWGASGIFNFEGGCYAKTIRVTADSEPEIYRATQQFGTILENVVLDPRRRPDFFDGSLTENTRSSYPIHHLDNVVASGVAGHPTAVLFLTADAFGVLPPISHLSPEQAMYHFISGYTAKVAGTERGVKEPTATFSACFGAPFLPRHPGHYAQMLGERLDRHGLGVWLVNTGWTGGPHGVGERISLRYTRAMVRAALAGDLDQVAMRTDPVFGVQIPEHVPGVPDEVLDPRATWSDGAAYDAKAAELAAMFRDNFQTYAAGVSADIVAAGPVAG